MALRVACLGPLSGLTFFSVFRGRGGVPRGHTRAWRWSCQLCLLILSPGWGDWIAFALSQQDSRGNTHGICSAAAILQMKLETMCRSRLRKDWLCWGTRPGKMATDKRVNDFILFAFCSFQLAILLLQKLRFLLQNPFKILHLLTWQSTLLCPQGRGVGSFLLNNLGFGQGIFVKVVVQMTGDSPGSPPPPPGMATDKCIILLQLISTSKSRRIFGSYISMSYPISTSYIMYLKDK